MKKTFLMTTYIFLSYISCIKEKLDKNYLSEKKEVELKTTEPIIHLFLQESEDNPFVLETLDQMSQSGESDCNETIVKEEVSCDEIINPFQAKIKTGKYYHNCLLTHRFCLADKYLEKVDLNTLENKSKNTFQLTGLGRSLRESTGSIELPDSETILKNLKKRTKKHSALKNKNSSLKKNLVDIENLKVYRNSQLAQFKEVSDSQAALLRTKRKHRKTSLTVQDTRLFKKKDLLKRYDSKKIETTKTSAFEKLKEFYDHKKERLELPWYKRKIAGQTLNKKQLANLESSMKAIDAAENFEDLQAAIGKLENITSKSKGLVELKASLNQKLKSYKEDRTSFFKDPDLNDFVESTQKLSRLKKMKDMSQELKSLHNMLDTADEDFHQTLLELFDKDDISALKNELALLKRKTEIYLLNEKLKKSTSFESYYKSYRQLRRKLKSLHGKDSQYFESSGLHQLSLELPKTSQVLAYKVKLENELEFITQYRRQLMGKLTEQEFEKAKSSLRGDALKFLDKLEQEREQLIANLYDIRPGAKEGSGTRLVFSEEALEEITKIEANVREVKYYRQDRRRIQKAYKLFQVKEKSAQVIQRQWRRKKIVRKFEGLVVSVRDLTHPKVSSPLAITKPAYINSLELAKFYEGKRATNIDYFNFSRIPTVDRNELKVGRKLGSGSFGDVYEVKFRACSDCPPVAMKVLKDSSQLKDQHLKNMVELSDHNTAGFYGVGRYKGQHVIFTEIMGSDASKAKVGRSNSEINNLLPVLSWCEKRAEEGVFHSDMKPQNFLVGKNGKIYPADFDDLEEARGLVLGVYSPLYHRKRSIMDYVMDEATTMKYLDEALRMKETSAPTERSRQFMSKIKQLDSKNPRSLTNALKKVLNDYRGGTIKLTRDQYKQYTEVIVKMKRKRLEWLQNETLYSFFMSRLEMSGLSSKGLERIYYGAQADSASNFRIQRDAALSSAKLMSWEKPLMRKGITHQPLTLEEGGISFKQTRLIYEFCSTKEVCSESVAESMLLRSPIELEAKLLECDTCTKQDLKKVFSPTR